MTHDSFVATRRVRKSSSKPRAAADARRRPCVRRRMGAALDASYCLCSSNRPAHSWRRRGRRTQSHARSELSRSARSGMAMKEQQRSGASSSPRGARVAPESQLAQGDRRHRCRTFVARAGHRDSCMPARSSWDDDPMARGGNAAHPRLCDPGLREHPGASGPGRIRLRSAKAHEHPVAGFDMNGAVESRPALRR